MHTKTAFFFSIGGNTFAYLVAVLIGLLVEYQTGILAAFWPASGVAVAILLLKKRSAWRYFLPAFFLINLLAIGAAGSGLPIAAGIAFIRVMEPAATAWLIQKWAGQEVDFDQTPHFAMLWLAAFVACGGIAIPGALLHMASRQAEFQPAWSYWLVGTYASLVTIVPFMVHLAKSSLHLSAVSWKKWVEAILFSVALAVITFSAFGDGFSVGPLQTRPYMVYLIMAWPALRFGLRGTLAVLIGFNLLLMGFTIGGHSSFPLGGSTIGDQLLVLQFFLGLMSITVSLLAVVFRERSRAESALGASLQVISAHIDNSPLAIVGLDHEFRVTRWSQEAQKIFGWHSDEIIGKPILSMNRVFEADLEAVRQESEGLRRGSRPRSRLLNRNYRKDGTVIHCEWYNSGVYDQDGRLVSVLSQVLDVTQRVQAEKIAAARLRIANFAIAHPLDEVLQFVLDEIESATGSCIGFFHFLDADQKTLRLQNWSSRTVNEYCFAEGKGAHYSVDAAGIWADCIRQRQVIVHNNYQTEPSRKGLPPGHAVLLRELVVPIFRADQIVAILGVGNKATEYDVKDIEIASRLADLSWDVAERKKVEKALHESELRYRIVADNTYDWEFWIDPQGEFVYNSPSCLQVTGYAADDFVRNPGLLDSVIYPEDYERYRQSHEMVVREKQPCGVDYRITKRDGEICWISQLSQPVYDDEGNYRGIRGNNRDVTQNKMAEIALRQSLSEKEILMRELQHRTKNNLNVVLSLLQLGQNSLDDPQAQEVFADVQSRIYSMVAIYEQLYRKGMVDRIELGKYVENLANELAVSYLPLSGRITMQVQADEIWFDLKRAVPLGLILNELIINALKYAFPDECAGTIKVDLKRNDGQILLRVSDNGIGLTHSSPNDQGSGTGLKLVRLLAKQINAAFTIENVEGTAASIVLSEAPAGQPNFIT